MTRKKFVKTLMASGVKRNAAVYLAEFYNGLGLSYDEALAHFLGSFSKVFRATIEQLTETLAYAGEWLGQALEKMREEKHDST